MVSNGVIWNVRQHNKFHSVVQGITLLFLITLSLSFAAQPALAAAGGSCPSTWNSIDPEGNTVSISSYAGISSCFYVSKATGNDSNAGTSEASPWAHLPGMPSCTANCASVTPAAGEGFVMRGGDTWTSGDLGVTWVWGGSGSSSQVYVGVDPGWFNSSCGGSWCRPIWNFSGTSGANAFLASPSKSYWWLDNVEITGMCNSENGVYVQGATNIRASQLYFHGWSHCVGSNNVGFFSQGGSGATADHNVIDGSDSSKNTLNAFYSYWSVIQYNYVNYVVSGVLGSTDIVHDNTILNTVTSADGDHCNGIFTFGELSNKGQLIYDNVVAMGNSCAGGVTVWFNGNGGTCPSCFGYGFGNIMYNLSGGNIVNFANHASGNYGTFYWFNNTVDCTNGGCGGTQGAGPYWTIYDQNNHTIGGSYVPTAPNSGGTVLACNNGSGTGCKDVSQTLSVANAQGYSSSEAAPYSPASACTSSTCSTVQTGANLATAVCSGLSSVNTAAYNACLAGSTASCRYEGTNHTLSCPNSTANAKPASAAWDVGAYQFSDADTPNPPTGLSAVVN